MCDAVYIVLNGRVRRRQELNVCYVCGWDRRTGRKSSVSVNGNGDGDGDGQRRLMW